jgi:hypothetical protein
MSITQNFGSWRPKKAIEGAAKALETQKIKMKT